MPPLPARMTCASLSQAFSLKDGGWLRLFWRLMPRELAATATLDGLIALIIIGQPYLLQWFLRQPAWYSALALVGFGVGKALLWNVTSCLNCRIVCMIQSALAAALFDRAIAGNLSVRLWHLIVG